MTVKNTIMRIKQIIIINKNNCTTNYDDSTLFNIFKWTLHTYFNCIKTSFDTVIITLFLVVTTISCLQTVQKKIIFFFIDILRSNFYN